MKNWTAARTANAMAIRQALLPFAGEGGGVRVPEFRCSSCPVGAELQTSSRGGGAAVAIQDRRSPCCARDDATECHHAYYKYYTYIRPENLAPGWSRDRILEEINARGVPCYVGSCSEVYLEKAFDNTGWRPKERLPVAKDLGETSLMFLVHPTLTQAEIRKTQEVVAEVLGLASNPSLRGAA